MAHALQECGGRGDRAGSGCYALSIGTSLQVDTNACFKVFLYLQTTLKAFREGKFDVLVATDVAARGLDINGVELVIQVEPPKVISHHPSASQSLCVMM